VQYKSFRLTGSDWLAVSVLVLACGVRLSGLAGHFTHVDDVGVAVTLMEARSERGLDPAFVHTLIHATDKPYYHGLLATSLRTLESRDLLQGLLRVAQPLYPLVAVPIRWTYAPVQFLLTYPLLSFAHSYREFLFLGRLPSMLASLAATLCIWWLYRRDLEERDYAGLAPVSICAFSLLGLIYSWQMESYAIGTLACALMLRLAVRVRSLVGLSAKQQVGIGLLLPLLVASQYQTIFVLPAFLGPICLRDVREHGVRATLRGGRLWGPCLAIGVAIIFVLFLSRHEAGGVTWNAGSNQEFLFRHDVDIAAQLLRFVGENTASSIAAATAPFPRERGPWLIWGICIGMLSLVGMWSLVRSGESRRHSLGVFILLILSTWAVLIAARKLTWGPSRHVLFLLPVWAVLAREGLVHLRSRWSLKSVTPIEIATAGVVALAALTTLPETLRLRAVPLQEVELQDMLAQHHVDAVITYGETQDLALMPAITARHFVVVEMPHRAWQLGRPPTADHTIAFVSTRRPLPESIDPLLSLARGSTHPTLFRAPGSLYHPVFKRESGSGSDMEVFPFGNGTNRLFLTILRRE